MSRDIGIVGAGIAGLHLGLFLLQRGIAATIYAEHTPDEMRGARLPSTTALYGTVREHMRQLGVAHWDEPDTTTRVFDFGIKGTPVSFHVPMRPPCQFIDMRLYLPRLLEDFAARGGRVVTSGAIDRERLVAIGEEHELVVVASGRGGLAEVFPKRPERSYFAEPPQRAMAALFRGIRFPEPFQFALQFIPGAGGVSEFQVLTQGGPVSGILVLAVPGGPLDGVTRTRYEDDPAAFDRAMLELLRENAPGVAARIDDPRSFGAIGPLDVLQGAVLPVARRGVFELGGGRFALALGDAHVTIDPVIAQGSNVAGKSAWLLGGLLAERIAAGGAFDQGFCEGVEARLWEALEPVNEWNRAALLPPAPHLFELFAAAARSPSIAEAFVANYDDPARQWEILKSAEGTAAFIQGA